MAPLIKVKAKVTTKGPDKLALIKKCVQDADGSYVSIGWPDSARYPNNGPLVGQVALWNELGTYNANHKPRNPARPFMRPAIEDNKGDIDKVRQQAIQDACFKIRTCEASLASLGECVVKHIKDKIRSNVPPPLAPSTAARKEAQGRAPVTLIDSGLMLATLGYTVHITDKLKLRDEQTLKEQRERAAKVAQRKEMRAKLREEAKNLKAEKKERRAANKETRKAAIKKLREAKKAVNAKGKQVTKAVRSASKAAKNVQRKVSKSISKAAKAIGRAARGKPPRKARNPQEQ